MIQKPNIKFSDRAISSLKNPSPNSLFFPAENQSQKPGTDHNLSYRGPIWVIQNPIIKFSDRATISLKDINPISSFF